MQSATVVLTDPVGLHARPAAELVQAAAHYKSVIELIHGKRKANAKSIVMVLALGARQGAEVTITAEGEDEEAALLRIVELLMQTQKEAQSEEAD